MNLIVTIELAPAPTTLVEAVEPDEIVTPAAPIFDTVNKTIKTDIHTIEFNSMNYLNPKNRYECCDDCVEKIGRSIEHTKDAKI